MFVLGVSHFYSPFDPSGIVHPDDLITNVKRELRSLPRSIWMDYCGKGVMVGNWQQIKCNLSCDCKCNLQWKMLLVLKLLFQALIVRLFLSPYKVDGFIKLLTLSLPLICNHPPIKHVKDALCQQILKVLLSCRS